MPDEALDQIYNFLSLDERLGTAGQPTAEQFHAVKEAGYRTVINLAMPDSPQALVGEGELVRLLGLEYIAIPVVWDAPQLEDLSRFFSVMDAHKEERVFVHCIANMRVSAFIYLYQVLRLEMNASDAIADLNRIWEPNETWQSFIETAQSSLEMSAL